MKLSMSRIRLAALLLPTVFFFVAYLLPLGGRVMIRPDEFRYAEIPREMMDGQNRQSPRLNSVRYFEKPTLGYRLTALCMKICGENAFAVRLPSALGTLLAAAVIVMICMRESRDPLLPGLAAGIFLASGLVLGVGTFAVLDAPFAGAVTLCMGSIYLAFRSERHGSEVMFLILAGVSAGVAFMLKGFLAFALPCMVAAPFLLWMRQWKKLLWWPWIALIAAVAVSAHWAWELHAAEPDFWRYFFVEEHFKRFTSATYDRKAQPFWYFVPVLLGGVLPAGLLWAAAWRGFDRKFLTRPFTRFMICWAVIPFIFFSASSCKLGTYILPCFPPLAILLASALRRSMLTRRGSAVCALDWICRIVGALFAVSAVVLVIAIPAGPKALRALFTPWVYPTLLCIMAYGAALYLIRKYPRAALAVFLFGAAPAVGFGMMALSHDLPDGKAPEQGIAVCARQLPIPGDCTIAVERSCIAAVCWTLKRSDIVAVGRMGEMKYGVENYREHRARFLKNDEFARFLSQTPPGRVVYITFKDLERSPLPRDWPRPQKRVSAHGVTALLF